MPFLDDNLYARYAIPGWDGSACLFRLGGAYETKGAPDMTIGTNICGEIIRHDFCGGLHAADDPLPYTSVTIMNAKHYGIFVFEASMERWVESIYDLDMILANLSLGALLFRWMVAKVAMLNSYRSGVMELQPVGIGVLSCARGFRWLPILLLPRLKANLAVLATIGGAFEGAQAALAQAWFLVYPGIAELMFFVCSLLNLIAKLLHRRI